MKIEKLTNNKIRIILKQEDLESKKITAKSAKKAVFSEISQFVRVSYTFDFTVWSFGEKPAKTAGKILCGFSLAGGIVSV